jgi:hypothetical protein
VDGTLRLADGWHRLRALELLGESTVEATIFGATMWEAQYVAAMAKNIERAWCPGKDSNLHGR